eukprot:scaffold94564_cov57-Phaeocystis_antarctica.AAC.1
MVTWRVRMYGEWKKRTWLGLGSGLRGLGLGLGLDEAGGLSVRVSVGVRRWQRSARSRCLSKARLRRVSSRPVWGPAC